MSEPVFGMTAKAVDVQKEMVAEHQQRLPAVGQRKRRVWPATNLHLTLMQYLGVEDPEDPEEIVETKFLGPDDQNGIANEGKGRITIAGITDVDPDATIYDVDASYLRAVVTPGDFFLAIRGDEKYYAMTGGVTLIDGVIDADGRLVADDTDIAVDLATTGCAEGISLVEGQQTKAIFRWTIPDGATFEPFDPCCPPDPE